MCRLLVSTTLVATLILASGPVGLAAATPANTVPGALVGAATDAGNLALSGFTVRLRNADTGEIAATTTTAEGGEFRFVGVAPGVRLVELLGPAGEVLGTSQAVVVKPGSTTDITVRAMQTGGSVGGGNSKKATLLILGTAAVAVTVIAIIATREDASPSR